jgi:mercuric ion transport protein
MKATTSIAAGFLSAFGATACCVGPLLLVTAGFGGAWAARLGSLEPLQPLFIASTLLFMGFAFHGLYVRPRQCAPGEACALPAVLRRHRAAFWSIAFAIAMMALFPLVADRFY